MPLPTVIVVHRRERRSKCSVEPLRSNPEFLFTPFPEPPPVDLSRYVRLGIGGPQLSHNDADRGLLLLDGTWRWAAKMEAAYHHVELRSLPQIRTAYPRKSTVFEDPSEGLATIEALYAAYRILNRDTSGLLDQYHWRVQFLELNGWNDASSRSQPIDQFSSR
jgi:pre-rRNA-processing protein TSR3